MRRLAPDHRRGGTVVDETFRRERRADALIDDHHDLEDALALDERLHPIADLDLRGGLGGAAVHADFPATAGGRRRGPGLVEPYGPEPDVYSRRLDWLIVPESDGPPSTAVPAVP